MSLRIWIVFVPKWFRLLVNGRSRVYKFLVNGCLLFGELASNQLL